MRLKSLLGGKIVNVKEDDNIIELIIEKNGRRHKVRFYPVIGHICTFDDSCCDVTIAYNIYEELR